MTPHEHLYTLLPAVLRRRDAESGEALRALLALLDAEIEAVRADTETAWDNAFVETSEEWLVPYLAETLRLPVTRDLPAIAFSRRAFVANAIRYRRAKGTAAALELLARDLTNYPARAVEFFQRLAVNEAINHPSGRAATVDLGDSVALEALGNPLGAQPRSIDVRRIRSGRGMHNLPNVGLFLWRSQIWRLAEVDAVPAGLADRAWQFRPTGGMAALYAPLETETDAAAMATAASVPLPLSRRRLHAENEEPNSTPRWPFTITLRRADGTIAETVPPERIDICHLDPLPAAAPPGDAVRVDPQAGVLVLGQAAGVGVAGLQVTTSHSIATAGQLGAGPWARPAAADWLTRWTAPPAARSVGFQVMVSRTENGTGIVGDLEEAVTRWHAHLDNLTPAARHGALGLILIGDSRTHAAPVTPVRMPAGAALGIIAADWPAVPDPLGGPSTRLRGSFLADETRPLLIGDLAVRGEAPTGEGATGEFYVDGVLLDGALRVLDGDLDALSVHACTVLGGLRVDAADGANAATAMTVERAIVGGIQASGEVSALDMADSASLGPITLPGARLGLRGITVIGATQAAMIEATDCLFDGPVTIDIQQSGCLRFCFLPTESQTPRRYRCQPETALEATQSTTEQAQLRRRLRPQYRSLDPFDAGFLLLSDTTPTPLRTGAEDGGEMGCWNHLQHQSRLTNLSNALPQFLRFGLEPGVFFLV